MLEGPYLALLKFSYSSLKVAMPIQIFFIQPVGSFILYIRNGQISQTGHCILIASLTGQLIGCIRNRTHFTQFIASLNPKFRKLWGDQRMKLSPKPGERTIKEHITLMASNVLLFCFFLN